ncbi:MAG: UDP-N-acetylmuramoyl-L-alanine--D-glutamate ligase [Moraxella sp.]|nr:UDP-N-acetylmuramoyl-L-alanine--D-glutamate ligase [Moraxella sp.]
MKDFLKNIKQGRLVVVGLGASGLSAVRHLYERGYELAVTDMNAAPKLAQKLPSDVATFFGGFDEAVLSSAAGIVISPGVDPMHPSVQAAKQAGVPIVSDVQLFVDECHDRGIEIIAITGSNAKSTVTTLVGQMAEDMGVAVGVGGNLGTPALELLKSPMTLAVLELSSFQLEGVTGLGAKVATLLNLSEDHLDRHGDMAGYLQAKLPVFQHAKHAVLLADDASLLKACEAELNKSANATLTKVTANPPKQGEFGLLWQDGVPVLAWGDKPLLGSDRLAIKGVHNLVNALFALAVGRAAGFDEAVMLKTLADFKGLPHRCQFVKKVGQSDYFNDSKGTNVGASIAGIVGLGEVYGENSLVLILGGQGKGQDFTPLADYISRYVGTVLTIGADAEKITDDLNKAHAQADIIACQTLENAVIKAASLNLPAVLLSPACASFDQFSGYEARGERFCERVMAL